MSKKLNAFVVCVVVLAGVGASGCGAGAKIEKALIDCVSAERPKIDSTITELGTKTKPDGSRDWSGIEALAIAKGVEIGGCALAEFVQSYIGAGSGSGSSGAPAVRAAEPADASTAQQTFEHFRSTMGSGAQFKTRMGTL